MEIDPRVAVEDESLGLDSVAVPVRPRLRDRSRYISGSVFAAGKDSTRDPQDKQEGQRAPTTPKAACMISALRPLKLVVGRFRAYSRDSSMTWRVAIPLNRVCINVGGTSERVRTRATPRRRPSTNTCPM